MSWYNDSKSPCLLDKLADGWYDEEIERESKYKLTHNCYCCDFVDDEGICVKDKCYLEEVDDDKKGTRVSVLPEKRTENVAG